MSRETNIEMERSRRQHEKKFGKDRTPPAGYETPKHLRDKGPRGQDEATLNRQLRESEQEHWKQ